jgi:hypothetical protein
MKNNRSRKGRLFQFVEKIFAISLAAFTQIPHGLPVISLQ